MLKIAVFSAAAGLCFALAYTGYKLGVTPAQAQKIAVAPQWTAPTIEQWMLMVESRLGQLHLERGLSEQQCTDLLVRLMEVPSRDNMHQMATLNRAWCVR